LFYLQLCSFPI
jgi:hypothetical protein